MDGTGSSNKSVLCRPGTRARKDVSPRELYNDVACSCALELRHSTPHDCRIQKHNDEFLYTSCRAKTHASFPFLAQSRDAGYDSVINRIGTRHWQATRQLVGPSAVRTATLHTILHHSCKVVQHGSMVTWVR
ncbi:hypothetical protein IF2G_08551 [Cordyceps javanica]|nr:hypothetical protein IF2G_08551 [Cordyceps javanica]